MNKQLLLGLHVTGSKQEVEVLSKQIHKGFFYLFGLFHLMRLGLLVQAKEGLYVLIIFISFKLYNLEPTQRHFTKRLLVTCVCVCVVWVSEFSVSLSCTVKKITKRMCSRAQSMVSRSIKNMPWRIKTSLKLENRAQVWRMGRNVAFPCLLISSEGV